MLRISTRIALSLLVAISFLTTTARAADRVIWEGMSALQPSPQFEKSLPPLCYICLQGQESYQFNFGNGTVEITAQYIVNYANYPADQPQSSGTLYLGLFMFPGDYQSLVLDPSGFNQYNLANAKLDSLPAQSYFQNVDETASLLNQPGDNSYAYLFVGEVTQVTPVGIYVAARDFVALHPSNQSACVSGECFFSAASGGGGTGGAGNGGGGAGAGPDGQMVSPNSNNQTKTGGQICSSQFRNTANPDSATGQQGQTLSIPVTNNDSLDPAGATVQIVVFPAHGTATVNNDNTISYTPNAGFTGTDSLNYKLGSSCGLASLAGVTITIDAAPTPVASNCPTNILLPDQLSPRTDGTSLLNISTRGLVGDCENVMAAGFIVQDMTSTYFIRGRGPSLGGSDPLADPVIKLYRGAISSDQLIASNDNWADDSSAACLVPGSQLIPTDPHEAALLVTLPPGVYIAVLESANATGDCSAVYGNGVIEINDIRLFPGDVQR